MQARYFLRLGSNDTQNAKTILEFCILQLQQKRQQANQVVEEVLGPEATFPLRPWALLFTKNKTALEQALQSMSQDMKADGSRWADRRWLEGIRICTIENVPQLKAMLCALHLSGSGSGSDLLSWIQHEHDNQPPCLIVVMDLLRLVSSIPDGNDCRDVQHDGLCKVLSLLVETSNYLTKQKRQFWNDGLGCNIGLSTDLLITDNNYLADRPPKESLAGDSRARMIDRLYNILTSYVEWLPVGNS
ncbi:hypothetical protein LRAMOSA03930 [Lichtheimia ramosa]|uniref:Uncharacterized protein n=1 Tax=Lichtheimia ramosa TaxID=688394 RepID=A0A077WXY1_9FUNG|nr:hypothetical protein LRAMOSA03930 [Lichtheimia ramosa]